MKQTQSGSTGKDLQIVRIGRDKLDIHPLLDGIPLLSEDQAEALLGSILKHGILEPLSIIPRKDSDRYYIIDGRNRYFAGQKASQSDYKCIVENVSDVLAFALDKAVTGRQLTKSGIALMLFLKHPSLADSAEARRQANLCKKPNVSRCDSIASKDENTYSALADRYHISRDYFAMLAKIREACNDAEWDQVKEGIFHRETAITALIAGIAGKHATKGKKRKDPDYTRLVMNATTTATKAFERWNKLDWNQYESLRPNYIYDIYGKVKVMLAVMPDALRTIQHNVIVESWPENDKKTLIKDLQKSLK